MNDFVSSHERAVERNADRLAAKAKARREAMADGLGKLTNFNTERIEDGDPNQMLSDYTAKARSGLKAILAKAAAAEAAALVKEDA